MAMQAPCLLVVSALLIAGCGGGEKPEAPLLGAVRTLGIESTAFRDGGTIPRRYTCDGEGISPPLSWSGVPRDAR